MVDGGCGGDCNVDIYWCCCGCGCIVLGVFVGLGWCDGWVGFVVVVVVVFGDLYCGCVVMWFVGGNWCLFGGVGVDG